ncbi:MAG: P1 family peptidase [Bacteroidales bacterium]
MCLKLSGAHPEVLLPRGMQVQAPVLSCFGFKGGIGTSSRVLPATRGGYTVGVLVQTNYGGILQVNGVPVGLELGRYSFRNNVNEYKEDGSCMIVVMTDAPSPPGI